MEKITKLSCNPTCGFSVQSHSRAEVMNLSKMHVKKAHPEMKMTDKDYESRMKTIKS